MQVLRRHAHEEGGLVDQLLADEARVGVDALAHGVAAHVLDAAGHRDVVRTEGDAAGDARHGGHGTGAHPVHGEAGDGLREAGQDAGGTAQGQALVADLGGGGEGDLVDPGRVEIRVAAQQLPDALDDQVVGAGLVVDALRARLAERGADAVDEDDVPSGTRHVGSPPGAGWHCCGRARRRVTPLMLLAGNRAAQPLRGKRRRSQCRLRRRGPGAGVAPPVREATVAGHPGW